MADSTNSATLKFNVDADSGAAELRRINEQIERVNRSVSQASKGFQRSNFATRKWNKGINNLQQGFSKLGSTIKGVGIVALAGFTASVFAAQRAVRGLADEFITINQNFASLEITLTSSLKSLASAKKITQDIADITRFSPLPFEQLANITRSVSVIPAIKKQVLQELSSARGSNSRDLSLAEKTIPKMIRLVEQMATFRPDQGAEGGIFALREALGGELRSLIRRFDLPATDLLERASGKSIAELKKVPEEMAEAMRKVFNDIISDEAVISFARLPKQLFENIIEQSFKIPLLSIGKSGIFDTVLNDFENFFDEMATLVTGNPLDEEDVGLFGTSGEGPLAKKISNNLTIFFARIKEIAVERLENLFGEEISTKSVGEKFFTAVESVSAWIANELPQKIDSFLTWAGRAIDEIENAGKVFKKEFLPVIENMIEKFFEFGKFLNLTKGESIAGLLGLSVLKKSGLLDIVVGSLQTLIGTGITAVALRPQLIRQVATSFSSLVATGIAAAPRIGKKALPAAALIAGNEAIQEPLSTTVANQFGGKRTKNGAAASIGTRVLTNAATFGAGGLALGSPTGPGSLVTGGIGVLIGTAKGLIEGTIDILEEQKKLEERELAIKQQRIRRLNRDAAERVAKENQKTIELFGEDVRKTIENIREFIKTLADSTTFLQENGFGSFKPQRAIARDTIRSSKLGGSSDEFRDTNIRKGSRPELVASDIAERAQGSLEALSIMAETVEGLDVNSTKRALENGEAKLKQLNDRVAELKKFDVFDETSGIVKAMEAVAEQATDMFDELKETISKNTDKVGQPTEETSDLLEKPRKAFASKLLQDVLTISSTFKEDLLTNIAETTKIASDQAGEVISEKEFDQFVGKRIDATVKMVETFRKFSSDMQSKLKGLDNFEEIFPDDDIERIENLTNKVTEGINLEKFEELRVTANDSKLERSKKATKALRLAEEIFGKIQNRVNQSSDLVKITGDLGAKMATEILASLENMDKAEDEISKFQEKINKKIREMNRAVEKSKAKTEFQLSRDPSFDDTEGERLKKRIGDVGFQISRKENDKNDLLLDQALAVLDRKKEKKGTEDFIEADTKVKDFAAQIDLTEEETKRLKDQQKKLREELKKTIGPLTESIDRNDNDIAEKKVAFQNSLVDVNQREDLSTLGKAGELSKKFGSSQAEIFSKEFRNSTLEGLNEMQNASEKLVDTIDQGLGEALRGLIVEGKSLKEVFKDFGQLAQQVLVDLAIQAVKTALKIAAIKAVTSIFGGFSSGGSVGGSNLAQAFATGGLVTQGSGNKDDVPAMLSKGEYVLNKDAVDKLGLSLVTSLNRQGQTAGNSVPASVVENINRRGSNGPNETASFKNVPAMFAKGGLVGGDEPEVATTGSDSDGQKGATNVEIVNVTDPREIDDYLASNPEVIMNVIRKNRQSIKASL